MVEIMLSASLVPTGNRYLCYFGYREQKRLQPCPEIHTPDARVSWCEHLLVRIGYPGVAVSRPTIVKSAKIRAYSPPRIRANTVDCSGEGASFAGLDAEHV